MSLLGVHYNKKTRANEKFNVFILIVSLVMGVISWIIGSILYNANYSTWNTLTLIGIVFAILCTLLAVGIGIASMLIKNFDGNVLNGSRNGFVVLPILIGWIIGVFVAGAIFQWLYSLQPNLKATEPTSFIFVIDDSGSTKSTDPNKIRYKAIEEVVKQVDPDFPYMIYSFASTTKMVREMKPASEGIGQISGKSDGSTQMKGALHEVYKDYKNKVWDGGALPKVILLSDGSPSDFTFFFSVKGVLKDFKRAGISISTVGYDSARDSLMQEIAEYTGGEYYHANNVAGLADAMKKAAISSTARDLVSSRYISRLNALYAIMRIVFVTILGGAIGFAVIIAYGNFYSGRRMIKPCAIKAFIGALIMELGTGVLGMSSTLAWFLLWLCIAATFVMDEVVEAESLDDEGKAIDTKKLGGEQSSREVSAKMIGFEEEELKEKPRSKKRKSKNRRRFDD